MMFYLSGKGYRTNVTSKHRLTILSVRRRTEVEEEKEMQRLFTCHYPTCALGTFFCSTSADLVARGLNSSHISNAPRLFWDCQVAQNSCPTRQEQPRTHFSCRELVSRRLNKGPIITQCFLAPDTRSAEPGRSLG
ncbi:hypothetical protein LSTR_LSTR015382 [Laodelphax striatellus]|uniref:Uncharacterized protein n=1 Tax=Laodelphax striatellus TaxID=195883 RepID=A0A482XQ50_LAOST|nr:hypothetical protein LSTR_LSTR015382 [Laodelphax striatellus]